MPVPKHIETSFIEKRQDERVTAKLEVSFERLTEEEEKEAMSSGQYRDVFASGNLSKADPREVETMNAFTDNVSISGLKLIGDLRMTGGEPLEEGMPLRIHLKIPGAPQEVGAIARVVWSEPTGEPGRFTAGLFFEGIHRRDADRVARFLVLQKRAEMSGGN